MLHPLAKGGTFLQCWVLSSEVLRTADLPQQGRPCVQKNSFPQVLIERHWGLLWDANLPKDRLCSVGQARDQMKPEPRDPDQIDQMKLLLRVYLLSPLLVERPKDALGYKWGGTPQRCL